MFRFSIILAASLLAATQVLAAPQGDWAGVWTKNGDPLPVTLHIGGSGEACTASFSSDALQVADIPFREAHCAGDRLHLVLAGDDSTTVFDGALHAGVIAGTFRDGDTPGTFRLTRTQTKASALETRDVAFRNGDVTLTGTLLLRPRASRAPAILFLHGSGPEGRWANRYLAQKFADAGFVALVYDKRGVGQSTGDWRNSGFDDLAKDAAVGIAVLRSMPEVDPARVGIYGHSQGGTLAPRVADLVPGLDFVIAASASGVSPEDTERFSVGNAIGIADIPADQQADARLYVDTLVDTAYRGTDHAAVEALAARFKSRSWYFAPPPADNFYWAMSRRIADFDPQAQWRNVTAHVLLVYGDHDGRIPVPASEVAISEALQAGGHPAPALRLYAGADHTFTLPQAGKGWPHKVEGYADDLVAWAKAQRKAPDAHVRSNEQAGYGKN